MASKRRIRRNACTGKRRFNDKRAALATALTVKRIQNQTRFVSAYKCKFCNGWHWGHS